MSDEDFWDIDQYQIARRNREIGSDRVVDPVRPASEIRAYDASSDRVEPIGREMPQRRRRERRQPRDIAVIHGLDEAQIDGEVRPVLADLIQEIGMLHDDLRLAEGRIDYLEAEIRQDDLGDWLDRRGFLGRLSQLSSLDEQEEVQSALMLVDIQGFQAMRRKQGWATADAVIADLGGKLARVPDCILGHITDSMFGILLVGMPASSAEETVGAAIPREVRVPGPDPALAVCWVAMDIRPGKSDLEQISAAERKLARLLGQI